MSAVRDGREPRGFALAVVLLLLLGLTALVHGGLLLARHQRSAAASGATVLQARLAAEAGVLRAAAALDADDTRVLRGGGAVSGAGAAVGESALERSRVLPLGGEWLWVESEGAADLLGLRGRRRTARLYWLLDPLLRARALRAAVEHGGELRVAPGAEVVGGGPLAAPGEWPRRICEELARSAGVDPSPLPAAGVLSGGPEEADPASPDLYARIPPVGLMTGEVLAGRADVRRAASAVGTPTPVLRRGVCDRSAPWNWGEPLEPGGFCGRHRPLVVAPGALTLNGGRGQGVLAAAGDLTLRGTRFAGLVLVGGSLRLTAGARIDGAVRVRGGVVVEEASTIAGSRCAAHRSLAVRPPALPPLPAPDGGWIPLSGR